MLAFRELAAVSGVQVIVSGNNGVIPGWDRAWGIKGSEAVLGWNKVLHWLICLVISGMVFEVLVLCLLIAFALMPVGLVLDVALQVLLMYCHVWNVLLVPVSLEDLCPLREVR